MAAMPREWLLALCFAGCAASKPAERVAPPPATSAEAGGEAVGGGGGDLGNQPEVVHSGKQFKLSWSAARDRYDKGNRCSGEDAPESVLGQPDQRNEMQQGRQKLVTYGYRFPEGTLLIRCRADHVELTRTLK